MHIFWKNTLYSIVTTENNLEEMIQIESTYVYYNCSP